VGSREGRVAVTVGEGDAYVGKRGKAREGHEETSREVACSEDVRLEVRVLHVLQRAVICRQPRTKLVAI